MGSVVALPLSGMLCQHGFAGGWPSVFYLFGESVFCTMNYITFSQRNIPGTSWMSFWKNSKVSVERGVYQHVTRVI